MGKYDADFHAWAHEQADAARRRSANEIDWDNVAEELESLGKQVAWELHNRYVVLLAHLLKWRFQPEKQSRSWRATIIEQRRQIAKHLRQNPSLKSVDEEEFGDAYGTARVRASGETDLDEDIFPHDPPFTPEEARADDFWPEPE